MPGARPVRDQASDLAEEAATGELDDANACSDHEEDNWGLSSSSGEKDDDSEDSDYEASRQVRKQEGVRQKNRQAAHQPPVKKQLPRVQYCTVSMAVRRLPFSFADRAERRAGALSCAASQSMYHTCLTLPRKNGTLKALCAWMRAISVVRTSRLWPLRPLKPPQTSSGMSILGAPSVSARINVAYLS